MSQPHLPPPERFLTLDCARGLAALAVVCYHMATFSGVSYEALGPYHYFSRAYLAVDLFFLISGFVIALSYEARLRSGAMRFGQFAAIRLIRLYPLYGLGLAGGFACSLWLQTGPQPEHFWSSLGLGALFLPQLADAAPAATLYPFNVVCWSLGFELAINLVFAAILARLSTTLLAMLCAMACAALMLFGVADGSLDIGFKPSQLGEGLAKVSASFIAGQILFRLWAAGRLPTIAASPAALLAGLTAVLAAPAGMIGLPYDLILVLMVFPLFVVAGCQARPGPRLQRGFSDMGRLSYAIYILHAPCIHATTAAWLAATGQSIAASPLAGGFAILSVVLAVSGLATAAFDEPLRLWLMAALKRLSRPHKVAMPSRPDLATL